MSNPEQNNDAGLADFMAGWHEVEESEQVTVTGAVIGLTNFGERTVPSTRLAEVLRRSVSDAEALARQWGWPGTRVENGLVSVNAERARSSSRRRVQVGDRRFGVTGCAPDIFLYAPLVRPSLVLEERCATTGTPIRLVFNPGRVESVDPSSTVVPLPPPQASTAALVRDQHIEDIDADL